MYLYSPSIFHFKISVFSFRQWIRLDVFVFLKLVSAVEVVNSSL